MLVEGAVMVALASVLSYIQIFKLPWGGSITLLSMLPIVVYSIKWGIKQGFAAAFVFSLVQLFQGILDGLFGWGLTPVMLISCILLDYIVAYSVLGIAGLFRKKGLAGWICGIALAVFARFACHFASGIVIWESSGKIWEGFSTDNTFLYSFLYNGCYMLPEMVFTVIGAVVLLEAPIFKKLIAPQAEVKE